VVWRHKRDACATPDGVSLVRIFRLPRRMWTELGLDPTLRRQSASLLALRDCQVVDGRTWKSNPQLPADCFPR